jgi:vacuolar-type H+-ATPase subunit I/STV1
MPVDLFKNTPMKRFYLAAPTRCEDQVIESLGALGSVHLITDYTIKGFKRVDSVERCEKYIKLQQRMASVLSALPPEKATKKSVMQSLKESFRRPAQKEINLEARLEKIELYVSSTETAMDSRLGMLEKFRSELSRLRVLEENLLILQRHGFKADSFGDFEYVFVRAGFMNKAFSVKLQRYVEGTSVRFAKWPEKPEEDFVVIFGLNRDKPHMEETLVRLNFAELALPAGINPDPTQALEETRASASGIAGEVTSIEEEIRSIGKEFQQKAADYEPIVHRTLIVEETRSTFSRTETLSLVHGWIPAGRQESLKQAVEASTDGAAFLRFEDPGPDDEPPAQLRNAGVARSFELLTRLRGTPQYRELDPTPIVTVLFTVMYGMMFGDVGQGIVLLVMGLIFSRLQRDFLKIPASGMRRLGVILSTCGISAVVFGALYGEFFLVEAFHPLFVNPIQGQTTMIIVALLFGVAQLTLGLVLKIVNLLRRRATIDAAFGVVRLVYYIAGVALAVKYAASMSFGVFTENLWLTVVALASLVLLFLSPTIEGVLRHEFSPGNTLMMGAAEFIETFLSYLTNSISYVRLAAFAIAHSALGLSAIILTSTIGLVPSYIAMNLLAMTIEALGVLIQCMRLTYYEFFTKFYSNGGVAYRPFLLPRIHGSIK